VAKTDEGSSLVAGQGEPHNSEAPDKYGNFRACKAVEQLDVRKQEGSASDDLAVWVGDGLGPMVDSCSGRSVVLDLASAVC